MARRGNNGVNEGACACGGAAGFDACCGPLLAGDRQADTAEQLMRSRYTAFVRRDADYLRATWHPETRPSRVRCNPAQRWLGLSIKDREAGGVDDDEGVVEFVARFKVLGRGHRLHERSRFRREDGRWFYLDGDHL